MSVLKLVEGRSMNSAYKLLHFSPLPLSSLLIAVPGFLDVLIQDTQLIDLTTTTLVVG